MTTIAAMTQLLGVADLASALGRPIVEPGRGVHLRSAAVKQCVVDCDPHRLTVGHEPAHDQRGEYRAHLLW